MSKEGGGERRRSARISALEEAAACKSNTHEKPHHHQLPQQQQQQQGRRQRDATSITKPPPPLTMHGSGSRQRLPDRKRGRKKKRLQDVVVTSVSKDEGNQKYEDIPINSDQLAILPSLQQFPEKRILEFILDVLQRRDTHEIFAEPVDAEEVEGYYEIVKEPMDFGTMRAKLQEEMYTTLEQFEHDVFLISSNAMLFNSSTTIYFRQARAIHELAKRVFHALKTDPENFELEFSLARKRGGRKPKPQGEAGGPHTKLATFLKPAGVKIGVSPSGRPGSSNGPSLSRNFQACLASSNLNFHIDGRESEILLGSGSGRSSNLFETERRQTYRPWTFFPCENDSIVSAVHNCPKSLMHVNHGDIGYKESLMKFVKDLGPTAQMVASRKLGLIEAPNCQSLTPAPSIKAPNCVIAAPPGPWGPAHVDGFMNDQMPQNRLRNLLGDSNVITDANERLNIRDDAFGGGKVQSDSMDIHGGAYRGKMACADHGRDIQRAFQGDVVPTNEIMGIYGGHRKDIYGALHGEMTTNTSDIMGISGTRDQTDGFGEVFREDIAHQNQDLQVRLGLYLPITGNGSSNSSTAGITTTDMMMGSRQLGNQAQPAQLGSESQSRLFEFIISKSSNCSESSVLPPQATQVSSLSQATISSHGFGSRYLGGEGPSNGPPGPNIIGASLEWSRPTPWGPRSISDFPYTQMRFSEESPWGQQDTLVRPELQLAPAPQGGPPTFDAASFNESSPPQSHQAEPSGQFFWNTQPLSLLDIQQPDLALQL